MTTFFAYAARSCTQKLVRTWLTEIQQSDSGFLLGTFSGGGAKSIVMQISFVTLLFSDQILGRGKSFQGGQTASGGRPPATLWKKARNGQLLWSKTQLTTL